MCEDKLYLSDGSYCLPVRSWNDPDMSLLYRKYNICLSYTLTGTIISVIISVEHSLDAFSDLQYN